MTTKTTTLRQLIRTETLDLDRAYSVVNKHGMDPKHLYPDNVELIRRELATEGSTEQLEKRVIDFSSITDDSIIKVTRIIRSDGKKREEKVTYMFAKDLENISPEGFENEIPFQDFVEEIDLDVEEIKMKKRKRGTRLPPVTPKPPTRPIKKSEVGIEGRLAQYLLNRNRELGLRAMLYGEPVGEPIDISHSTLALDEIVKGDLLYAFRTNGYTLEALTPEVLMKKAKEMKNKRLNDKVSSYLRSGGKFLSTEAGFNPAWNTDDSIREVIYWLEQVVDQEEKGLPFYICCIKAKTERNSDGKPGELEKITEGLDQKRRKNLFSAWSTGARHYEVVKSHPYTRKLLEKGKKLTFEEVASQIVNDFAGNPQYKQGDARRFIGGLFVAGRLSTKLREDDEGKNISYFQYAERIGNSVDYLLMQYQQIKQIVGNVVQRIKQRDSTNGVNSADTKLYEQIRTGDYSIDGEDVNRLRHLRRAITKQFTEDERRFFARRDHSGKYLSDFEVDRIVYFYVKNEGNKILN